MNLANKVRHVPDFPKAGIDFIDITTVLADPQAFRFAIDCFIHELRGVDFDVVASLDSRGFIFATPVAYALNKPFVPIRKKGKLPYDVISQEYALEYGTNTLEIHTDAIAKGQRVVIIDDILATGGTIQASIRLIERLGGVVKKILFLAELSELAAVEQFKEYDVISLAKV